MTKQLLLLTLCTLFLLCTQTCKAQSQIIVTQKQELITQEAYETGGSGYVNFNLGQYPTAGVSPLHQTVYLFGCNTKYATTMGRWQGIDSLSWDTNNQVLKDVPYGYRQGKNYPYYISKYYMASPPLFHSNNHAKDTTVTIGLVLPDRFTFYGDKPVEIVHLDYSILQPVWLTFITTNYDYTDDLNPTSCADYGVDLIPLNLECTDFPWATTAEIPDGKGASGIAEIYNKPNLNGIFLASNKKGEDFLQCSVSILDDIILDYEVYYSIDGVLSKELDLTNFYLNHPSNPSVNLVCIPRTEPPAGCVKNGEK